MDTKQSLNDAQKAEAEASIRTVGRLCRGPISQADRNVVNLLLNEGNEEDARNWDAISRPGCGYDFNNIVVDGPWDGESHPYTCPKCGCTGSYQAPAFQE